MKNTMKDSVKFHHTLLSRYISWVNIRRQIVSTNETLYACGLYD
jgi:hypothetical protein